MMGFLSPAGPAPALLCSKVKPRPPMTHRQVLSSSHNRSPLPPGAESPVLTSLRMIPVSGEPLSVPLLLLLVLFSQGAGPGLWSRTAWLSPPPDSVTHGESSCPPCLSFLLRESQQRPPPGSGAGHRVHSSRACAGPAGPAPGMHPETHLLQEALGALAWRPLCRAGRRSLAPRWAPPSSPPLPQPPGLGHACPSHRLQPQGTGMFLTSRCWIPGDLPE